MLLEEYEYVVKEKKIPEYITVEIFFNDSDEENSDEENSNEEN